MAIFHLRIDRTFFQSPQYAGIVPPIDNGDVLEFLDQKETAHQLSIVDPEEGLIELREFEVQWEDRWSINGTPVTQYLLSENTIAEAVRVETSTALPSDGPQYVYSRDMLTDLFPDLEDPVLADPVFSWISVEVNEKPTLEFVQSVFELAADFDTSSRLKVADLTVVDDDLGTNNIELTGEDSAFFELEGDVLYLKAGSNLDILDNPSLDVSIEVDDPAVGSEPDDTVDVSIALINNPPEISVDQTLTELLETTDVGARVKIAAFEVIDDGIGENTVYLSGVSAPLFEIVANEVVLRPSVALSSYAGQTLTLSINVDDETVGASPDDVEAISIVVVENSPPSLNVEQLVTDYSNEGGLSERTKVAEFLVVDDGVGENEVTLTGDDASSFEIVGGDIFLRGGVNLGSIEGEGFDLAVQVEDPTVGLDPDDSVSLPINLAINLPPVTPDVILEHGFIPRSGELVVFGNLLENVTDPDGDSVRISPSEFAEDGYRVQILRDGRIQAVDGVPRETKTYSYTVTDAVGNTSTGQATLIAPGAPTVTISGFSTAWDAETDIRIHEGETASINFDLSWATHSDIEIVTTVNEPGWEQDFTPIRSSILSGESSAEVEVLYGDQDNDRTGVEQTERGTLTVQARWQGEFVPIVYDGVSATSHTFDVELRDYLFSDAAEDDRNAGFTAGKAISDEFFKDISFALQVVEETGADYAAIARGAVGKIGSALGAVLDASAVINSFIARMQAAESITNDNNRWTVQWETIRALYVEASELGIKAQVAAGAGALAGLVAGAFVVPTAGASAVIGVLASSAVGFASQVVYDELVSNYVREALEFDFQKKLPMHLYLGTAQAAAVLRDATTLVPEDDRADLTGETEAVLLGDGEFLVSGTPDALNGDKIFGFGSDDRLIIPDLVLTTDQIHVRSGSLIIGLDVDDDGAVDSVVSLEGDYDVSAIRLSSDASGSILSLEGEGVSVPVSTIGFATNGDDLIEGTSDADNLEGAAGNDRLLGDAGDDSLDGGLGADTLNGDEGDDIIFGGPSTDDLRDVVFAGAGNDSVDAGAGNDLVYGQSGNDTIAGGAGVDELQGQDGDDVITGSNFSDLVFGGAGNDFVNGGFGHDRINGGSGADKFFHAGVLGHGSDWLQDYSSADGDVLLWGGGPAVADDFQVNFAHTANAAGERSGDDAVQEAFVIYRPTEQIIWALVDGGGQSSINLQIGGEAFDLLT